MAVQIIILQILYYILCLFDSTDADIKAYCSITQRVPYAMLAEGKCILKLMNFGGKLVWK